MPHVRSYRTATRLIALVGVAAFAAACSSDTAPSASQQLDVSAALGAMTVPGVSAAMSTTSSTASSADVSAPSIVPSACSYTASSQSFTCPAVNVNGLTIQRSYTLLDAQGQPQSAPDKSTTDGIETLGTVTGTVAMGSSSMTVDGVHHMKLSGLLSGQRVLDGGDTTSVDGTMSMGGTSTPLTMKIETKTDKVALPAPGSTQKYPLSGTVSMDMTSTSGASGSTTSSTTSMVLTFNGSSTATMTITTSTGVRTCSIDLTGKSATTCTP